MKTIPLALALAMTACLIGCAGPRTPGPAAANDPRVGDVIINSARFGSGTDFKDVTERVTRLLHTDPKGFAANADRMGVDPQPRKAKTLVITYHYQGAECVFAVTSPGKVSYELLLKNAQK